MASSHMGFIFFTLFISAFENQSTDESFYYRMTQQHKSVVILNHGEITLMASCLHRVDELLFGMQLLMATHGSLSG